MSDIKDEIKALAEAEARARVCNKANGIYLIDDENAYVTYCQQFLYTLWSTICYDNDIE